VKRTNEVQTENFAILLVQKHIRVRWCLPVDRGEVSQERDPSRLRNRVRHDASGDKRTRVEGTGGEGVTYRVGGLYTSSPTSTTSGAISGARSEWGAELNAEKRRSSAQDPIARYRDPSWEESSA